MLTSESKDGKDVYNSIRNNNNNNNNNNKDYKKKNILLYLF
jgi:hypothetical protein